LPLGGLSVFLMRVIRQQLELLRMGRFDGGPVAPSQEAAGAQAPSNQGLEVDAGGSEGARVLTGRR
jgi:hypothetical protein